MALLAVLPLLAARPARRAQSAEVSWTPSWDDQIQTCLKSAATNPPSQDPTVTHARVTKFLQNAFSSVEVALSGENGWNPDFVWITNAEGTVIALQSSPGTGNTGLTWTAPATGNSEPPSQLNVHTCPPLLNSTGIDSWRGRYEAAVAYCCAELDPTPAQKQTFGISLRVNWLAQTITASASQQAVVLNYVRNEAGTVMGVAGPGWDQDGPTDALTMSDFGDGSTTSLLIPPLSQSLVACALNSELTKEICTTVDLVSWLAPPRHLWPLRVGSANASMRMRATRMCRERASLHEFETPSGRRGGARGEGGGRGGRGGRRWGADGGGETVGAGGWRAEGLQHVVCALSLLARAPLRPPSHPPALLARRRAC